MNVKYSGWKINRDEITSKIQPDNEQVICHHITYQHGNDAELPHDVKHAVVYGYVRVDGIDVVLVSLDGIKYRSDGSLYHITLSLNPEEYKPCDSNTVIKENPVTPCEEFEIRVKSMLFTERSTNLDKINDAIACKQLDRLNIKSLRDEYFGLTMLDSTEAFDGFCKDLILTDSGDVHSCTFDDIRQYDSSTKISSFEKSYAYVKEDGYQVTMSWCDKVSMWVFSASGSPTLNDKFIMVSGEKTPLLSCIEEYFTGSMTKPCYSNSVLEREYFMSVLTSINEQVCSSIDISNTTFIFELCIAGSPVVVNHGRTKMKLIGARNRDTGEYIDIQLYARVFELPERKFVESVDHINDWLQRLREQYSDIVEGVVLYTEDGKKYSFTTPSYEAVKSIKESKDLSEDVILQLVASYEDSVFLEYYPEYTDEFESLRSKRNVIMDKFKSLYDESLNMKESGFNNRDIADCIENGPLKSYTMKAVNGVTFSTTSMLNVLLKV